MHQLNKAIRILDKVGVFSRWTNIVGLTALFLMISLTFVDVVMRYIFNRPLEGQTDLTEVMMIVAIFLAVAHTQNEKGHISIDLITMKLAPKARIAMEFITTLLGLGTFVIVIWRTLVQAMWDVNVNAWHRMQMPIPKAPFDAIIALGCTTLCLLLLRDLLANVAEARRLGLTRYHWLLMLGVPILILVLAILWMQPTLWQLSLPTVGVIGAVFCLILFLVGMPISFALILTSLLFIGHIRGFDPMLNIVGADVYQSVGSWQWAVLPFFVLMGYFCLFARFGEDLYLAAYRWFGHLRGGLAIATVGACTGFAAIVGDPISATATMGSVALPQMKKYKYDDRLTTGSITGGATLGPIIPPSVPFLLFGILTSVSVGDLFVAGIIPGLVIAAMFVLVIYVRCRLNPNLGPPAERSGWRSRLVSLRAGGPVIVLFLLVIGGIYMGVFTPNEGGAIGGVVAFLMGLAMRRFTWKVFTQALLDAGKTVSMVFLILIGGLLFTRFAAWCNLSGTVTELITGAGLSPTGFMLLVLLIFLILGCFIDLMPLLLIGVPILFPIAVALGINPIWFGVLVTIVINLGAITPPVGINLFVLKGLYKEIPMGTIYSGTIPFTLATVVAVALIFVVPPLATWLPSVLK